MFGIAPMKATMGDPTVLRQDGWAYEIKWDGYRTLVFIDGGQLRLQSSNLIDVTRRWPELAGLADAVNTTSCVLDGEAVAFGPDGRPDFGAVQRGDTTITFVAFDLLHLNGIDTMVLPFEQRRHLLDQVLEPGERWLVAAWERDGVALGAATAERGMEGIVAKRLDSRYLPGKRSPSWRKVKHRRRQEFVVGGFSAGTGHRASTFGSLLLGVWDAGALRCCGAVGTGFDQRWLDLLTPILRSTARATCPFDPMPPREISRGATWVEPVMVVEVEFAEWTSDGIVRHSSFLGTRDDKDPASVVREPG